MTVIIASVGLPAFAAFDARAELVRLALDGPLQTIVLIATLAPVLYYVRVLGLGLRRLDSAIGARRGAGDRHGRRST